MARTEVSLDKGWQSLARRKYAQALAAADEALTGRPLLREERAEWLRLKAAALAAANACWVRRAVSCLNEGLDLVRDLAAVRARLLGSLAAVYAEDGDHRLVHRVLQRFMNLCRQHPDPEVTKWEGHIRFNLALCYAGHSDHLHRAAQTYRQALASWDSAGSNLPASKLRDVRAQALHNLSGVLLRMGDLEQARETAEQAARMLNEATAGAKISCRRAEILLAYGDAEGALALLATALEHGSLSSDELTRTDILFTWARAEAHRGQKEAAHAQAVKALDLAARRGYPRLMRQILALIQDLQTDGMEVLP